MNDDRKRRVTAEDLGLDPADPETAFILAIENREIDGDVIITDAAGDEIRIDPVPSEPLADAGQE